MTSQKSAANPKIKTLKDLAAVLTKARKAGKTVALCHGVFDLMHPGTWSISRKRARWRPPGRDRDARPFGQQRARGVRSSISSCVWKGWPRSGSSTTSGSTSRLPRRDHQAFRPHFYVKGADYADQRRT